MHDILPHTQTQGEIQKHKCKWFLGWTVNQGGVKRVRQEWERIKKGSKDWESRETVS